MRLGALRIADLADPAALGELLAAPEGDMVERKRVADAPTLAKVVSAFANAVGGWLLLGVDDDGTLVGWRPPGRAHVRDWLRDVLDDRLDPMPHFEAEVLTVDGVSVGVVRVPRSVAAPHFINETGETYERRNGQTRRASPARVRQLTLRDSAAERDLAVARLDDREVALDLAIALDAPRANKAMHPRELASIMRISLLEPSETFCAWVHSPQALQAADAFAEAAPRALDHRGLDWSDAPRVSPARATASGHSATATWDGRILAGVTVAWDEHGLGGVRLQGSRLDDSGVHYFLSDEVRDRWLCTSLEYLVTSLELAAAFGPAIARWDLYGVRGGAVVTQGPGNVVAARGSIPAHYDNAVAVDLDIEVGATGAHDVAVGLWRQLGRLAGAPPPD